MFFPAANVQTLIAMQEAELTILYNFYIDCMPSDDMAEASLNSYRIGGERERSRTPQKVEFYLVNHCHVILGAGMAHPRIGDAGMLRVASDYCLGLLLGCLFSRACV